MNKKMVVILLGLAGPHVYPQNMMTQAQLDNFFLSNPQFVTTPLTYGTGFTAREVTLIETDEGTASLSLDGRRGVLSVDTQGDVYTSSVNNLRFTPGRNKNTVSGEGLEFSSTTTDTRTDIERFSFAGSSDEFQLKLHNFHTTGPTSWGGERLTFNGSGDDNRLNATKLYIRKENGDFVEIGEADYSEANKSLRMTSVLGQTNGYNFSADQAVLMQRGNTDIGRATNLYIGKGPDEFIQVGSADIRVAPNGRTLSLTSLNGSNDGYDFSADTFNYSNVGGSETANATGVFIRNAQGEFIQIGEADYSEANKSLRMTSVLGQTNGYNFSADQAVLMQRGNTDIGRATNLYIGKGPDEFIQVGSADIRVAPNGRTLSLTSLNGSNDGYDFSADTFNYSNVGGSETANATGVFIRNAQGEFIQIGEADYSEANKSLRMTSVLGQTNGYNFSADQAVLMQRGNTDIGRATNLYIGKGPDEFIQVGSADIRVAPNGRTLSLTSLNGSNDGYDFSADTFNYSNVGGSETANATGVFIRNAQGEFIQIGEADYSEANKSLRMTSVLGQTNGYNFSADQAVLMQRGNTDIGRATNLYIGKGPDEFIQVGSADITLAPQGNSLRLTSINSEFNGYSIRADEVLGFNSDDYNRVEIINGEVSSDSDRLSFGDAIIDSDGERINLDANNLSVTSGDLSYTTNSLIGSTNGDSFDLNTRGVLRSGGNNLDLTFVGTGVNSFTTAGPAPDGGILIEEASDGRITRAEGVVAIGTTEDGGFSDIGVALGDTISFTAKDADGNARELSASFSYNEEEGKFYLKTVFTGGDETQIKVMPFTFTSEKIGEDAVAALSASLEKQNIEDYLNTMSRIIDLERINDFVAIGRDRMQIRVGRENGLEMYYANNSLSILDDSHGQLPHLNNGDGQDIAFSLGFFNRGQDNTVRSGGVLLSSDSSLRYNVESGTLAFNGIELPDRAEIPLTVGAYYRHEAADGTAVFGTIGTSLAELGSVSAGVVVERPFNERITSTAGLAGNTSGDIAANIGFEIKLGRIDNSSRSTTRNNSYNPSDAGDMARSLYGFENALSK